jgi:hypothetical protein
MLSLAYAGEAPELRADEFLSVRSVHPEQMTYEMTNSRPEIDRFVEIFTPHLSRRERIRMRVAWALEPAARLPRLTRLGWVYLVHYVLGPISRRLVTPVLTWGGDLLEHVPERWRPPIRHRDCRRKSKPRPGSASRDDQSLSRNGPLPPRSLIGLEPVSRDPGPSGFQEVPGGMESAGSNGFEAEGADRNTERARIVDAVAARPERPAGDPDPVLAGIALELDRVVGDANGSKRTVEHDPGPRGPGTPRALERTQLEPGASAHCLARQP